MPSVASGGRILQILPTTLTGLELDEPRQCFLIGLAVTRVDNVKYLHCIGILAFAS